LTANPTSPLKVVVCFLCSLLLIFSNSQAQNNSCGLHALYAPSRDTFSKSTINLLFINFSTGDSSFQWLVDGNPYYYTTPVPDTFQVSVSSVGIHKIQLAVSNGLCRYTATSYVIITGNPPANFKQLPQQGFLMSIGQKGCINWAKQLSAYYNTTILQSIRCANGDILSLCNGANYTSVSTTIFLIRTTQDGNLLWAKGLNAVLDIGLIKEDADQNICLLGNDNENIFTIG